ncbi:MAG: FecR domain-containing protein [Verrucomicrobia bacterium]|nr:FecR domain-containing protein [Verrucomicrobiota bacterium]
MNKHAADFESSSIEETAADWFVRRRDGLPREAEREYQAWVDADPRHAAAMAECHETWEVVRFPAAAKRDREAARVLDQWAATQRRRPYLIAAAGLAAAVVIVFTFLPLSFPPRAALPVVAVAVRPNVETLADGSTVELNAGAEIAVSFTPERRSVRLVRGEAFFSVTKDAARPFVVTARDVEVRAVGTAFAVRFDTDEVGVLVTEGRVAVEPVAQAAPKGSGTGELPSAAQPTYLDAGRRVAVAVDHSNVAPPAVKPLSAEEVGTALAWRDKRVEFSRMPLLDVAALFNTRNRVQLSISDGAAASIPISGIFWSDDPEGFVRLLESGLGVRSKRSADTIFLGSR